MIPCVMVMSFPLVSQQTAVITIGIRTTVKVGGKLLSLFLPDFSAALLNICDEFFCGLI